MYVFPLLEERDIVLFPLLSPPRDSWIVPFRRGRHLYVKKRLEMRIVYFPVILEHGADESLGGFYYRTM
jgi:hypothetical protein